MSGTSQAAAVTSGVVALLLQAQPGLTPNQVKCKLMSSARRANDPAGGAAYSVVFSRARVSSMPLPHVTPLNSIVANRGLDIDADLADRQHYGGPARQASNGEYYVADANGV